MVICSVYFSKDQYYPGDTVDIAFSIEPSVKEIDWLVVQAHGQITVPPWKRHMIVCPDVRNGSGGTAKDSKKFIPSDQRLPENTGLVYMTNPQVLKSGLLQDFDRFFSYSISLPCLLLPSYTGRNFKVNYFVTVAVLVRHDKKVSMKIKLVSLPLRIAACSLSRKFARISLPIIPACEIPLTGEKPCESIQDRNRKWEVAISMIEITQRIWSRRSFKLNLLGSFVGEVFVTGLWQEEELLIANQGGELDLSVNFHGVDALRILAVKTKLIRVEQIVKEEGERRASLDAASEFIVWQSNARDCSNAIEVPLSVCIPRFSPPSFTCDICSITYKIAFEFLTFNKEKSTRSRRVSNSSSSSISSIASSLGFQPINWSVPVQVEKQISEYEDAEEAEEGSNMFNTGSLKTHSFIPFGSMKSKDEYDTLYPGLEKKTRNFTDENDPNKMLAERVRVLANHRPGGIGVFIF